LVRDERLIWQDRLGSRQRPAGDERLVRQDRLSGCRVALRGIDTLARIDGLNGWLHRLRVNWNRRHWLVRGGRLRHNRLRIDAWLRRLNRSLRMLTRHALLFLRDERNPIAPLMFGPPL
jgi:hypothetical protein